MDSKQNEGWYVVTRCDAIKGDLTIESSVIKILWQIRKIARSDRLATRPEC